MSETKRGPRDETITLDGVERWEGRPDRECGDHRTLGGRAWCFECSEYCSPGAPCRGCELPALRADYNRLYALALDMGGYLGSSVNFGDECAAERFAARLAALPPEATP